MKKVLALSLVFALFTISAPAQNEKTENLRRHLIEQRMHNRDGNFRHPGMMRQRQGIMQHRLTEQRVMRHRHRALTERRNRMQMQQRRKMMIRRHYMHRRII